MEGKDLKNAYSEVLDMLRYVGYEYKSLIPRETIRLFENECNKIYLHKLEEDTTDIESKEYSDEALAIIAYLNLKYWCKNDNERSLYKKIYMNNSKKNKKDN